MKVMLGHQHIHLFDSKWRTMPILCSGEGLSNISGATVLMELWAGAKTKEAKRFLGRHLNAYTRSERIIALTFRHCENHRAYSGRSPVKIQDAYSESRIHKRPSHSIRGGVNWRGFIHGGFGAFSYHIRKNTVSKTRNCPIPPNSRSIKKTSKSAKIRSGLKNP